MLPHCRLSTWRLRLDCASAVNVQVLRNLGSFVVLTLCENSGERSYLAPPPYKLSLSVCLSVCHIMKLDRGVGVDSVMCVSVCPEILVNVLSGQGPGLVNVLSLLSE